MFGRKPHVLNVTEGDRDLDCVETGYQYFSKALIQSSECQGRPPPQVVWRGSGHIVSVSGWRAAQVETPGMVDGAFSMYS